jgi:hypothetical protein
MTLLDDRLDTAWSSSSLTTAPAQWRQRTGPWGSSQPTARHAQAPHRELLIYAEDERLPRWFNDHLNLELNRLFALTPGWDGYTADEVTIEAVHEMVEVLFVAVSRMTVPPQFFPLADGGLQAEWHIGGNDIEIEVDGAGSAYALATKSTGETVTDAEIQADVDDPQLRVLATFLNELSSRPGLAH